MNLKITTLLLLIPAFLFSQEFTTILKGANSTKQSAGHNIIEAHDGGYICSGYISEDQVRGYYGLVKFNRSGEELWRKKFSGRYWDGGPCNSILKTPDGNYLTDTRGMSSDFNFNHFPEIIKFNDAGDTIWRNFLGPEFFTFAEDLSTRDGGIIESGDGNYFYKGILDAHSGHKSKFVIIKFSPEGAQIWSKSMDLGDRDALNGHLVSANGILYAFIVNRTGIGLEFRTAMLQLDLDGNMIEENALPFLDRFSLFKVHPFPSGGFLISYISEYEIIPFYYLKKIDETGQIVWEHDYPAAGKHRLRQFYDLPDDGFRAVGIIKNAPIVMDFDTEGISTFLSYGSNKIAGKSHTVEGGFWDNDTLVTVGWLDYLNGGDFILDKQFAPLSPGSPPPEKRVETMTVFGNPIGEEATIKFPYALPRTIRLLNQSGAEVQKFENTSDEFLLQKGNLPGGFYFLEAMDRNKNRMVQKVFFIER